MLEFTTTTTTAATATATATATPTSTATTTPHAIVSSVVGAAEHEIILMELNWNLLSFLHLIFIII